MTTVVSPPKPAVHLPTPQERPNADVLIYDGHCKFCIGMVERLAWCDGKGRVAFLSLHDPEVVKRYPDFTYDQLMTQMYLVTQAGERYPGAAAVRYLSRHLPRLYWLAPLLHIPFSLPLWQWGYRQVARIRYSLMGKTNAACDDGTCKVHFK
jgi:predicted DCC family thiol-disulfide oxidoreductase YuxK